MSPHYWKRVPFIFCTYVVCPKLVPVNAFQGCGIDVDLWSVGVIRIRRIHIFWASWIRIHKSEVRIRILPFPHRGVERIEIMLAK
jgi:hypothetical protein